MIIELEKARRLKQKLKAGECCLGAQIALSDPTVAEIFGRAGFDWMVVDTEHSAQSALTVRAMLQAAMATPAVLLARPLRFDADEIRRYLDFGSPGVLCPFINSGKEAAALVSACRYPPRGIRGWGPRRASAFGFDGEEYMRTVDDSLLCIPIIESAEAIERIEEIVSVDGIDGITLGPMDLSISLGCFKQFDAPQYLAAVDRAREACHKYGKAMGTGCYSLEHARQCAELGDGLLLAAGDDGYLVSESRRCIETLRTASAARVI